MAKIKSWMLGLVFGVLAIALMLWQAFTQGKKSEKADAQNEVLDNVTEAKKSENRSGNLSTAERIERMRKRTN